MSRLKDVRVRRAFTLLCDRFRSLPSEWNGLRMMRGENLQCAER